MNVAIDNDVLFKGACYGLLDRLLSGISSMAAVLGSARFIIPKKLERTSLNGDRAKALETFLAFLSRSATLEPTDNEQGMAADLELAAQRLEVNLDAGESQLCAIMVRRAFGLLLTGDKRAIVAIERLLDAEPQLTPICGRVKCLEQVFVDAVAREGHVTLRVGVCGEAGIDKALAICFSCKSQAVDGPCVLEGLRSYINDLRRQAGRVLAP